MAKLIESSWAPRKNLSFIGNSKSMGKSCAYFFNFALLNLEFLENIDMVFLFVPVALAMPAWVQLALVGNNKWKAISTRHLFPNYLCFCLCVCLYIIEVPNSASSLFIVSGCIYFSVCVNYQRVPISCWHRFHLNFERNQLGNCSVVAGYTKSVVFRWSPSVKLTIRWQGKVEVASRTNFNDLLILEFLHFFRNCDLLSIK